MLVILQDSGNMVLASNEGVAVWESFSYPTDTWLPGMKMDKNRNITCWKRSTLDPSPGQYSLRQLRQSNFGEFELVFNGTVPYWSSGKWLVNLSSFAGIPQVINSHFHKFTCDHPFTSSASFGYMDPNEYGAKPLKRIIIDSNGQIKEYIWSTELLKWDIFWLQPHLCDIYGFCGNLGVCNGRLFKSCKCLVGFHPSDKLDWSQEYFMGGCCRRDSDSLCGEDDLFQDIGLVSYDAASSVSFPASRSSCGEICLQNCSCLAMKHDNQSGTCTNLYGFVFNLRKPTLGSTDHTVLHIRIPRGKKKNHSIGLLIGTVCGGMVILGLVLLLLMMLYNRKKKKKDDENAIRVRNLMVFTYKELYTATRGFSETLGHGGFGTVYRGKLSDSTLVAVKRLERPSDGEREFQAEGCTIGNIQHVNLVRLRGFCSENSHRLLVYDYLRNGSLGTFLRKDGQYLSWDSRFRVAIGMAQGIAYLHEECQDCILHCDIKPENILLDDNFTAKVSDFGMAKLIGRDFSRGIASRRGTRGYVAPEWISGVEITAKADVYSYGMTLLEIIGGRRNVETAPSEKGDGKEGTTEEKWFFPPWAARQIIEGNVAAVVDDQLVGAYNTVEVERMALVAVWCIQDEEHARPAMGTVVRMLQGTVAVTVPPPPQMLQALVSGASFRGVGDFINQDTSTGGH